MNVPAFARLGRAVRRRTEGVWTRDRADLRGLPALWTRTARIAVHAARGVYAHRLGLQGAALTYYTAFAIVPLLVVLLWSAKAAHLLPAITPEVPSGVKVPTGNQLLAATLGQILDAVGRTSEITSGVVGLAVLLFTISKLFAFTERALHIIAASGQRAPSLRRVLGYVALLLVPAALLAVSGVLLALLRGARAHGLAGVLGVIPGVDLALGIALGLGALWLAVTLLYSAAVRARIPFASAAVGGALASLALVVVFWVFASFQIGASKASALGSGFLAFPVFLLWVFSSWYTFLVGAEIAVAHHVDRVLVHGAASFRLDCAGQRRAGVALMVQLTERAAGGQEEVTADTLARPLRLPPSLVRDVAFRLVDRGLLAVGKEGFILACDPSRTTATRVADAVDRDPKLGRRWAAPLEDVSLEELAERRHNDPPPAALKTQP
ncbi:MAG TPA: YihY/virulence factor BrkB family protein [Polyangia bacterium]|nr:YihY/virulence factor BrkB family protein [Polyangia bacterium]